MGGVTLYAPRRCGMDTRDWTEEVLSYEDSRPHGMGVCGSHIFVPVFTEILQESFDPSGVTPVTVQ